MAKCVFTLELQQLSQTVYSLTLTISSVLFLDADASFRSQCLSRKTRVSGTQRVKHQQNDGADDGRDELLVSSRSTEPSLKSKFKLQLWFQLPDKR